MDGGGICFDCLRDALPLFRIEAGAMYDHLIAWTERRRSIPLTAVRTRPVAGYDRAARLPALLPQRDHWLAFLHDPEWAAPAWREWQRAEINIWLLERELRRAYAEADESCATVGLWLQHARELQFAIEAERTFQRIICELEAKRGQGL